MTSRREFVAGVGATSLATIVGNSSEALDRLATAPAPPGFPALYDVDRSLVNLDAAYYGAMTREVHARYRELQSWVNRHNSAFLRNAVRAPVSVDTARSAVAQFIGAAVDEVALCGGGTEALYSLIANFGKLAPGDAVLYADIDYDEMQFAMEYLSERGARVIRFPLPEPHTRANLLDAYDRVLRDTPRARLLLVTHISNRHGLVLPVPEIVALAKARGVDVILDAAQSVGMGPFDVRQLGADFVGFSLHKWIAAPLGTGAIYVRRDRLADVRPWFGNRLLDPTDILARVPTGTVDVAARMTIPTALAVHDRIGSERKWNHLRLLRDRWVTPVRGIAGVELPLPEEPDNYGAIGAFRLPGMRTIEQTRRAVTVFMEQHRLLVVAKAGLASGPVLRVTPGLYNSPEDLDRLVSAIRATRGLFV